MSDVLILGATGQLARNTILFLARLVTIPGWHVRAKPRRESRVGSERRGKA